MKFDSPLTPGKLLKRYKRFMADIQLDDGSVITAHVPNTGPMTGCLGPHWPVLLSHHTDPKRKYPYTLEMTHNGKNWIGVNTMRPNRLVEEAFLNKKIKELLNYETYKREVRVGDSRPDFLFESQKHSSKLFLEVKNVTLIENNVAYFPDTPSERATKHVELLMDLNLQGYETALFFLIQREDATSFSPAHHIDLEYAKLVLKAKNQGVQIICYECLVGPKEITLSKSVPVQFEF
jgi:sugar fermentation stimulation protein A